MVMVITSEGDSDAIEMARGPPALDCAIRPNRDRRYKDCYYRQQYAETSCMNEHNRCYVPLG
jgi:hypothetical protein